MAGYADSAAASCGLCCAICAGFGYTVAGAGTGLGRKFAELCADTGAGAGAGADEGTVSPPRLAGGQRQPLHCLCTPAGQYRRHSDRTPWRTAGSLGLRTQEIRAAAAAQPALVGRAAVAVAAAACGAQVAAGLGGSYLEASDSWAVLGDAVEALAAGSAAV